MMHRLPWHISVDIPHTERFEQAMTFVEEYVQQYDLSRLMSLVVDTDPVAGNSINGTCTYPRGNKGYCIKCHIVNCIPSQVRAFQEHKSLTDAQALRTLLITDYADAMVWLAGHELAHLLLHSHQLPGRNSELQADRYAVSVYEAFLQAFPQTVFPPRREMLSA